MCLCYYYLNWFCTYRRRWSKCQRLDCISKAKSISNLHKFPNELKRLWNLRIFSMCVCIIPRMGDCPTSWLSHFMCYYRLVYMDRISIFSPPFSISAWINVFHFVIVYISDCSSPIPKPLVWKSRMMEFGLINSQLIECIIILSHILLIFFFCLLSEDHLFLLLLSFASKFNTFALCVAQYIIYICIFFVPSFYIRFVCFAFGLRNFRVWMKWIITIKIGKREGEREKKVAIIELSGE